MLKQGMLLRANRDYWLWSLVALAFVLRFIWMITGADVMENEGGLYTRTAENLLRGRGFESIYGAPETMYTLLPSVFIAVAKLIVGNSDLAARMIAIISGTCLTLPVYFLARRLYGITAGRIGAALVAVSPLLIGYSVAVYTETPYMVFVMSGAYLGFLAFEYRSIRYAIFSGLFWGLAYETRVEGIAYLLLTFLAMWVVAFVQNIDWRIALRHTVVMGATGMLVASPYIYFLWQNTGELRLEGKNVINYTIIKRMETGLNYDEAAWGIDKDLNIEGPLLTPNRFATHSQYAFSGTDTLKMLPQHAKHNLSVLLEGVFPSFAYGSPLLWGFIVIGFFRRAWNRERALKELWIFAVAGYAILLLLLAHLILFRYTIPLYAFLLVWASNGIYELSQWARESSVSFASPTWRFSGQLPNAVAVTTILVALLGSAGFGAIGVNYVEDVKQGFADHDAGKQAGLWLKEHAGPGKTIMDVSTHVAYYSDGIFTGFPYAATDLALRYIDKVQPDYLVTWAATHDKRPYLQQWLESGIPNNRIELVYENGDTADNKIRIYHYRKTNTDRLNALSGEQR